MGLLYEKIAKKIEAKIEDGSYPVSMKLPGEERLAKKFAVARPTLHKAILLLQDRGIIESRPSIGNFVIKKPNKKALYAYVAPNLSDPFHAEFIRELNAAIVEDNGSLLIDENSRCSAEEIIERLRSEDVAGVIYCSPEKNDSEILCQSGLPAVWFSSIPECDTLDYIVMNNDQGIRAVVEHLAACGIKEIGYAEGDIGTLESSRRNSFITSVKELGLKSTEQWLLKSDKDGEEGGRQLCRQFLNLKERPQAIVCYNDWNAIGFIEAALQHGLKIPEELRVTGFDNLLLSRFLKVPLTTVDCNLDELAQMAFKMLSDRIRRRNLERQIYIGNCHLVIRKS